MMNQVPSDMQLEGLACQAAKFCRSSLKRGILCAAAWAAVFLIATVVVIAQEPNAADTFATASAGTGQATAQQRPDAEIEADVVRALDSSEALKKEPINAATTQGQVTIFGTVSSESAHELALLLVSHVNGVVKVTDHLKVAVAQQPAQQPAQGAAPGASGQQSASAVPVDGVQPPQVQMPPSNREAAEQGEATPAVQNPQMSGSGAGWPGAAGRPNYPQSQSNPAAAPQYRQQPPPAGNYDASPITIPPKTLVQLRTTEPLDSKHAQSGTMFEMTVIRNVRVGDRIAIPRGALVHGVVVESKQPGKLGGAPVLSLEMQSLELGGHSYTLASDDFRVRGPSKTGYSASNILGGAGIGTLIGAMVGRGPGAAVGAVVGAGAGTAISASTPGARAWIPAEALVDFHLAQPVTVTPVSPEEAQRLGQGLFEEGPRLNRRGAGFYAGAPYAAQAPYPAVVSYPNPYAEPLPFYHPYYMMGGYYYWR